jgi:endonuclease G, mitochondrial
MSLPGRLVQRFEAALLDAFPDDDALDGLIRRVGLQARVPGRAALDARIAKLVAAADAQGRAVDLVYAAIALAPGNALLARVRPLIEMVAEPAEYLGDAYGRGVLDALRRFGLDNAALDALATQLPAPLREILPVSHNALARLDDTFHLLNAIAPLPDGTAPLARWLAAVPSVNRARGVAPPAGGDRDALGRAIDGIQRAVQGVPPIAAEKLAEVVHRSDGREEKIVQQDDMLPFAFLAAGAAAGRAVCRLIVPWFSGGKQLVDIAGAPRRGHGSGWLIAPDLVITNHHVVNNRSGKLDAADDDLRRQAEATTVEFDYDAAGSAPVEVAVVQLVAWSPRQGPLDYAIVRLAAAPEGRRPLPIMPGPFTFDPDDDRRPAVNIIQHPGRDGGTMYKMVACRNNLVFRAEGANLWYFTDTLGGSSGSPVCNDRWQAVALHKRWDRVDGVSYQGKPTAVANAGTQLAAILDDLGKRPELVAIRDEILAAQPAVGSG